MSLPRNAVGLHWPNHRRYHLEQLLRVVGQRGSVTGLHHDYWPRDEMTGHHGDGENNYVYGLLRFGRDPDLHGGSGVPPAPERLIHLRGYEGGNWQKVEAKGWGRHLARKLSRWEGHNYPATNLWMDPFLVVSFCNEQNIEPAGYVVSHLGGEDVRRAEYARMGQWQLEAMRACDDELDRMGIERRALFAWGAFAFGHDMVPGVPDSEYTEATVREAIEYADVLTAHPYGLRGDPRSRSGSGHELAKYFMNRCLREAGHDGNPLPGVARQFAHKPLLITETNTFDVDRDSPEVTAAALEAHWKHFATWPTYIGSTAFMWCAGPEHSVNNIEDERLRELLERVGEIPCRANVPTARPGGADGGGHPVPVPPPDPAPEPEPPIPDDGSYPPRLTAEHQVVMVARRGEGWGSFAGRARGYPDVEPGWGRRKAWADEIKAHNGLGPDASLARGRAYRIPWLEVAP